MAFLGVVDAPLDVDDLAFLVLEVFFIEETVLVLVDVAARDLFVAGEIGAERRAREGAISRMFIS